MRIAQNMVSRMGAQYAQHLFMRTHAHVRNT